jgi:hypothetical protein
MEEDMMEEKEEEGACGGSTRRGISEWRVEGEYRPL